MTKLNTNILTRLKKALSFWASERSKLRGGRLRQIFVAFSEYMNFNDKMEYILPRLEKALRFEHQINPKTGKIVPNLCGLLRIYEL